MIRKVEMERFSVTSSKPFDAVVAAIKASIGHPNMAELWQAAQRATTAAELEATPAPKPRELRAAEHAPWVKSILSYERRETTIVEGLRYG